MGHPFQIIWLLIKEMANVALKLGYGSGVLGLNIVGNIA